MISQLSGFAVELSASSRVEIDGSFSSDVVLAEDVFEVKIT